MLKIIDIRLREQCNAGRLRRIAAGLLEVPEDTLTDIQIHKSSIDARRKPDVRFVYALLVSVDNERDVLSRNLPNVSLYVPPEAYEFPLLNGGSPEMTPVVVGMGPAGMFASLCLAEAGVKCVILERGQPVERRNLDVERFRRGAGFEAMSNVQFGEGGAGTYSDGKLTTGISDRRIRYVLERLVRFGSPEDILYSAKPHIGTDNLRVIVRAIRDRLIELGCDIRFGHTMTDIDVSNNALRGVIVRQSGGEYRIAADTLILAPGNSARDTFEMLIRRGVRLSAKNFSVGVRIEHLQRNIDSAQYGDSAITGANRFPASDYKLAAHFEGDRSVYTFCVCPGGQVISSSSEHGGVAINGMSYYARDGSNCNGALLVSVTPDDYGGDSLSGVMFQRKLESAAFAAGGANYRAPAQMVGDFMMKRASNGHRKITPTYMPGVSYCDLWSILPGFVCTALRAALEEFSGRVTGFADPDAILTAVETRSSSPVRIDRENYETIGVMGIFPCGEGSGYAGGIMSSAVDGIKCAEQIVKRFIT